MQWILLLVVVAVMLYAYRGRTDTTPAPSSVAVDGAGIEAVDFYWRPG
ncbi:MAG: hypothetical protein ACI81L_002559 [Verrucomicrobiales bacterium]|jgi:hypothetical protein